MDVTWQPEPRFQSTTRQWEPTNEAPAPARTYQPVAPTPPVVAPANANTHERAFLQSHSLSEAMGSGPHTPMDLAQHGLDISDAFRRAGWE